MARAPGEYVPLDVNYVHDERIRKAGTNAELLFLRSLAYAKRTRSDGRIPQYDLEIVAVGLRRRPEAVQKLLEVGLWEEVEGGWQIRSWFNWNMTQGQLDKRRKARRDAAIKGNHERWHIPERRFDADCPHCVEEAS